MGLERLARPFQAFVSGSDGRSTYVITRWMFLRVLGAIYLVAFVSLGVQVRGLIGSEGILPAQAYLEAVREYVGPDRFLVVPTVFWLNASDAALQLACAIGALCATLVACNVACTGALVVSWVLYLSLVVVGCDFLSFQWDGLLLETGFLAIFFAPRQWIGGWSSGPPISAPVLVLFWWLLFRLTFQSGLVKLTWSDPTWRDLSALDFHFYTQPLPTWTAWYAQQLPLWSKRLGVIGIYVLERGFPLLICGPARLRVVACAGTVLMQLAIRATGQLHLLQSSDDRACPAAARRRLLASVLPRSETPNRGSSRVAEQERTCLARASGGRRAVRERRSVLGKSRSRHHSAAGSDARRGMGRPVPEHQQLRPVSSDDHVAPGDCRGGERRPP